MENNNKQNKCCGKCVRWGGIGLASVCDKYSCPCHKQEEREVSKCCGAKSIVVDDQTKNGIGKYEGCSNCLKQETKEEVTYTIDPGTKTFGWNKEAKKECCEICATRGIFPRLLCFKCKCHIDSFKTKERECVGCNGKGEYLDLGGKYHDCLKCSPLKVQPTIEESELSRKMAHDTEPNYCCACEYDLVVMEDRIESAKSSLLASLREKVEGMKKQHYCADGCLDECEIREAQDNILDDILNLLKDKGELLDNQNKQ